MTSMPGFDQPLYILPFDHRGTFLSKMFGAKGAPTAEQSAAITAMKQVIYDGFRAGVADGVPHEKAGILVDEQFGADILRDANAREYTTACCRRDRSPLPGVGRHLSERNGPKRFSGGTCEPGHPLSGLSLNGGA